MRIRITVFILHTAAVKRSWCQGFLAAFLFSAVCRVQTKTPAWGARWRSKPCTLQTGTLNLHTVFTTQTGTLYICEKVSSTAPLVYKDAVFDTNRKSLLRQLSAEKGHKTRASEVPHLVDASFGSLFSVYSVVAVSRWFWVYLPCKIGSRGIIKKCGKIKRYYQLNLKCTHKNRHPKGSETHK